MTQLFKNCLNYKRGKIEDPNVKVYNSDVKDFDSSFDTISKVMAYTAIRLTKDDSPRKRFWCDLFYWFELLNMVFALVLEVAHMVNTAKSGTFQDAIAIFKMMPCSGYVVLSMAKSYKIVYHRPVFDNLVKQLRAMWPRGTITEEEHKIISVALQRLNFVIKGYFWCNNVLLLVYMSTPFLIYFCNMIGQKVTLVLPFFYWFPFDPFESDYFILILIMQTWQGVTCIYLLLCGDMIFCNFMSHISTQFELLAIRLQKTFFVEVDGQLMAEFPLGMYSKEHKNKNSRLVHLNKADCERIYRKEIVDILVKHQTLIGLSEDVENQFSFSLLLNFISSSVIICFCGFCVAVVEKWNEMDYKFFLVTALIQTLILCWYGQRLMESSQCVADAVYNSGWYKVGKKINSSLLVLLVRSQKGVRVTTYGFSVICLQSYTTIIKTSWSYFTLLLTIFKK